MARPAQQGHRPPDRLQLRSLYGFLNRQDHGDLPLRHEGRPSTFDELQLRHQRSFLHCLTILLSLRYTGTTTLSKNCTRTEKNTVSICLCCTTGMSTILSRNTKNSKSCWNLSLKITGTPTTRKRSLRELSPLLLLERGSPAWTLARSRATASSTFLRLSSPSSSRWRA